MLILRDDKKTTIQLAGAGNLRLFPDLTILIWTLVEAHVNQYLSELKLPLPFGNELVLRQNYVVHFRLTVSKKY